MVKAIKYPKASGAVHARYKARLKRQARAKAVQVRIHSVPRTAFGIRLRVSGPTKKAWRRVVQSPNDKRVWQSRGQKFLNELNLDIWTCSHLRRRVGLNRGCSCAGGGVHAAPTLVVGRRGEEKVGHLHGDLGLFERALFRGRYHITVALDGDHPLQTLAHEAQHWIDFMAPRHRSPDKLGIHGPVFDARLADLLKQLGGQRNERQRNTA